MPTRHDIVHINRNANLKRWRTSRQDFFIFYFFGNFESKPDLFCSRLTRSVLTWCFGCLLVAGAVTERRPARIRIQCEHAHTHTLTRTANCQLCRWKKRSKPQFISRNYPILICSLSDTKCGSRPVGWFLTSTRQRTSESHSQGPEGDKLYQTIFPHNLASAHWDVDARRHSSCPNYFNSNEGNTGSGAVKCQPLPVSLPPPPLFPLTHAHSHTYTHAHTGTDTPMLLWYFLAAARLLMREWSPWVRQLWSWRVSQQAEAPRPPARWHVSSAYPDYHRHLPRLAALV